ncbi:hypothetical protein EV699_110111 [Plasticicumulans lactativorans]|uniref:Probable membrane transporter protein n=1 Tax=Plasticicumulans lactativorans TaxID=1133106 RepID=A0A4R2LA74_9GAMM|nr:sulfite exporter TauE/SafE family protein [Plasticicumulans lactativorans]TCO81086.1 hypothetical protein EV699_110111 [Plasticicumulans lactativorans]
MEAIYVAVGLGVGVLVGVTGIGGGALMTPILVLGFGIPVTTAVGTDLVYACVTKISAVIGYARRHALRWDVVGLLLCGSLPGAIAMLWGLHAVGTQSIAATAAIRTGLGIAVVVSALLLFAKRHIQAIGRGERLPRLKVFVKRCRPVFTVAVGLVLGALVALTSVGAGTLGTAALIMLYPGMLVQTMVGTEIAHAVLLTAVAGYGHWSQGNVDHELLFSLLAGSIPGAYLGSHLGLRLPDRIVRPLVACCLIFLGGKLIF